MATATTPAGETISYRSDGLAMWTGHPEQPSVWLDSRNGSIVAKNPDDPTIAKLLELAGALRSRVQGDDGEFYDPPPEGSAPPDNPSGESAGKGWRRVFKR